MLDENIYIYHWLTFTSEQLQVDGKLEFKSKEKEDFKSFSKRIYKSMKPYPKFYKMDKLSKLAFLSGEMLLKQVDMSQYDPEKTAFILSNSSSTIETDKIFQETIDQVPSPAVFVYTLPNIMIGELSIRFGLKGENLFFVEPTFNPELLAEQVNLLFTNSATELCITGWIDFYSVDRYKSFLCLAGKSKTDYPLTAQNLGSFYNQ